MYYNADSCEKLNIRKTGDYITYVCMSQNVYKRKH